MSCHICKNHTNTNYCTIRKEKTIYACLCPFFEEKMDGDVE